MNNVEANDIFECPLTTQYCCQRILAALAQISNAACDLVFVPVHYLGGWVRGISKSNNASVVIFFSSFYLRKISIGKE